MFALFLFFTAQGFLLDSVYIGSETDCSGTTTQNVFIQLLLPCMYAEDSDFEFTENEGYYLAWSEVQLSDEVEIGPGTALDDVFQIGAENIGQHLSFGETWLIAAQNETISPSLEAEAQEMTDWLHSNILNEYRYLLLIWKEEDEASVMDTLDLQLLNNGALVAKRDYAHLNEEYNEAVSNCQGDEHCIDEITWGETSNFWPGFDEDSWDAETPTCDVEQDLEVPAEACQNQETTQSPTASSTLASTRVPSVSPTSAPQRGGSQAGASSSNDGSTSKSFTSQVWFFIILFAAGMAMCGLLMKFCKTSSIDDGFIAAEDFEEGVVDQQRSSLIMMERVQKGLAMMDGEDAHFEEDGLGSTPKASEVRPSQIVKQREGEPDQLEGLPTGHQIIKASSIGNHLDMDPKRSPESSEPGENDITSLE